MKKLGLDGWPEIVFANHEMFGGEETQKEAEEMLGEVADNLPEFLRMAAEGELDNEAEE